MPLIIKLKPGPHALDESWTTKEFFEREGIDETLKIIRANWEAFRRDLGGLENIIESVEWVEE